METNPMLDSLRYHLYLRLRLPQPQNLPGPRYLENETHITELLHASTVCASGGRVQSPHVEYAGGSDDNFTGHYIVHALGVDYSRHRDDHRGS